MKTGALVLAAGAFAEAPAGPAEIQVNINTASAERLAEVLVGRLPPVLGAEVPLHAVAGDAAEIDADLASFTTMLILALALLGLGLVVATFFQVRFGRRSRR